MKKPFIMTLLKTALYLPAILLILLIAIYPLQFLGGEKVGILKMKTDDLINNATWSVFFYIHIMFGALALLIGWLQFIEVIQLKYRSVHRLIGKIYVIAVWLSGLGACYIVFFAEGGVVAFFGFAVGALVWMVFTIGGYITIRKGNVTEHKRFMIYSYATCLAAVSLRVELPILVKLTDDFILSYQIVSWLCWGLNLVVAYAMVKRRMMQVERC